VLSEESRRCSFPSLDGRVYLDTAAEGILPLVVGAALNVYFGDKKRAMDGRESHFRQWEAARELTEGER
jgi:cysteine desulfurase/selenocysteine lyase